MRRIIALAMASSLALAGAAYASPKDDVKKGNVLYNNSKFDEASKFYDKALSKEPKNKTANFNAGCVSYRKGSYNNSIEYFNKAIAVSDPQVISAADYNIGNTYYKIGAQKKSVKDSRPFYETALKFYKRAIDLNPKDRDAKFNYEFIQGRLNEIELKKKEKDEEKEKKEKKEQDTQDKKQEKKQENKEDKDQNQGGGGQGQEGRDKNKEGHDKKEDDQGSGGQQDRQEEQQKESQPQKRSGDDQEKESGREGEGKDEKEDTKEENREGRQGKDNQSQGGQENKPEEDKVQPGQAGGMAGEEDKETSEEQAALTAYQAPQGGGAGGGKDAQEMTEQEAKMLLEGYKGEEATGRVIRMRRKPLDMAEAERDW